MSEEIVVLVTGVGSGVAQSIIKALNYANEIHNRNYTLIGTDVSWKAAGLYSTDKSYIVPPCRQDDYLQSLVEICKKNKVDFVIPGTDPELYEFIKIKGDIENKTNAHVLINPSETIEIGYDKYKTSRFLEKNGFPYPVSFCVNSESIGKLKDSDFPFIIKPRYGSGSVGLSLIENQKMLANHLDLYEDEMIIQEDLASIKNEYTCGLVFSSQGELMSTLILQRDLKKGFTQFAKVVDQEEVQDQILKIASKLKGRGTYNIQGQLTKKGFVVFEINPRYSGTTAFRAVAGQNEPDLYIQNYLYGTNPECKISPLCMARYLNEYYFDFDKLNEFFEQKSITNEKKGFTIDYF